MRQTGGLFPRIHKIQTQKYLTMHDNILNTHNTYLLTTDNKKSFRFTNKEQVDNIILIDPYILKTHVSPAGKFDRYNVDIFNTKNCVYVNYDKIIYPIMSDGQDGEQLFVLMSLKHLIINDIIYKNMPHRDKSASFYDTTIIDLLDRSDEYFFDNAQLGEYKTNDVIITTQMTCYTRDRKILKDLGINTNFIPTIYSYGYVDELNKKLAYYNTIDKFNVHPKDAAVAMLNLLEILYKLQNANYTITNLAHFNVGYSANDDIVLINHTGFNLIKIDGKDLYSMNIGNISKIASTINCYTNCLAAMAANSYGYYKPLFDVRYEIMAKLRANILGIVSIICKLFYNKIPNVFSFTSNSIGRFSDLKNRDDLFKGAENKLGDDGKNNDKAFIRSREPPGKHISSDDRKGSTKSKDDGKFLSLTLKHPDKRLTDIKIPNKLDNIYGFVRRIIKNYVNIDDSKIYDHEIFYWDLYEIIKNNVSTGNVKDEKLERFIRAQKSGYERNSTHAIALDELIKGTKTSHWVWYCFPTLTYKDGSPVNNHFAIVDNGEAKKYLLYDVLVDGKNTLYDNLCELYMALLRCFQHHKKSLFLTVGQSDHKKVISSIALFMTVSYDIEKYKLLVILRKCWARINTDEKTYKMEYEAQMMSEMSRARGIMGPGKITHKQYSEITAGKIPKK